MKQSAKRVCIMSIAVVVMIAAAEMSTQASEVEPIGGRALILLAQAPVTPESAPLLTPVPMHARVLVGHWRKTTIVFEQPKDEHLVLRADGTAENWIVTASSRSPTTAGVWRVDGKILELLLEGQEHIAQPFTIHEGQLVFPNLSKRRRFWEKIE